ncbi:hypothetical protein FACS1894198_4530 [Clostridia bacterium]|nr:hypothetical protein FACS1894198_4530 [Clostridia bacterium]
MKKAETSVEVAHVNICVELLEELILQGYEGKELVRQFAEKYGQISQLENKITCPLCKKADQRGYRADLLPPETLEAIAESDAIFSGKLPWRKFESLKEMYRWIEEH